jgi:hypothetical protein
VPFGIAYCNLLKLLQEILLIRLSLCGFRITTFENAEIRAVALGALHALQPDENPNEIYDGVACDSGEKNSVYSRIYYSIAF